MTTSFNGYGLIVTVEQNADARLPDLGASVVSDGDHVERVLLDPDVCGYGSDRVIRLQGKNATAEAVLNAFDHLRKAVSTDNPVFFYFSGHGDGSSCDGSDGACLFPYDADLSRCRNVLTSKVLGQAWQAIPSKRKVAVVDACYSGGIRMTKASAEIDKRLAMSQLKALSDGEGMVLISSSRSLEPSLILRGDGMSLFTKHLVSGLRGMGGHDDEGFVRVFDLFNHVAVNVRRDAPDQSPVYAAYHQDSNFAVAYCQKAELRKARAAFVNSNAGKDDIQLATALFCALYPLGPTDQAIWERAGGNLSRLTLTGNGRTDWFRAIQLIDRGGGFVTLEKLCEEALSDYPLNRDLEQLAAR